MSLTLSTEADRGAMNAAVARALGWWGVYRSAGGAWWGTRPGRETRSDYPIPGYLTNIPLLNQAMLDLLRRSLGHEEQVRLEYGPDWHVVELLTDAPALLQWGSHSTHHTEAEALVHALVAKGVVKLADASGQEKRGAEA